MAQTRQDIYATTFIARQHDQIRELFDAVEQAAPEDRAAAFEPLVRLLAVHETAEEMVIYPAAARGEAGKEIVEQRKAEEDEVFPLLTEVADTDQLKAMTAELQMAEGMAPTHPHKLAPESAMGNLLVGPFVAMVDRVRDAIRDARRG